MRQSIKSVWPEVDDKCSASMSRGMRAECGSGPQRNFPILLYKRARLVRSRSGCVCFAGLLCFSGSAPAPERLRRRVARLGLREKFADVDGKSFSQAIEDTDGWVLQSTLESADIGTVHVRIEREAVLREIAFDSDPP
jgi:hypothetical protein